MRKIEFTGNLAGEKLKVFLTDPHPNGSHWQVLIDHYYHGTITKRDGKWIGHLNPNSDLQADDIQILGGWVDHYYPQG
ncbi:MAG: hypothetical protein BGO55_00490 [Sphingobacteriales bacterium 50-39]|nr:hypothetical protein [Sphingobacteriales bacterium]OJW53592.1 MAG: hypothetical protein BGO55_00490 [Sphingobacteriales bacterium 50-39]